LLAYQPVDFHCLKDLALIHQEQGEVCRGEVNKERVNSYFVVKTERLDGILPCFGSPTQSEYCPAETGEVPVILLQSRFPHGFAGFPKSLRPSLKRARRR